jgi:hypothetical protein
MMKISSTVMVSACMVVLAAVAYAGKPPSRPAKPPIPSTGGYDERVTTTNADANQGYSDGALIFSWDHKIGVSGDPHEYLDEKSPKDWERRHKEWIELDSAQFRSARGDYYSVCSASSCSSTADALQKITPKIAKEAHGRAMKIPEAISSTGPGEATLRFSAASDAAQADASSCQTSAAGKHFKDAKIKLLGRDAGSYTLRDVAVIHCDTGSMKVSFSDFTYEPPQKR